MDLNLRRSIPEEETSKKSKRLPPLPKFPKVKGEKLLAQTNSPSAHLKYRYCPRISKEDVQYILTHDEYNKAIFNIWKEQKDALYKRESKEKRRYYFAIFEVVSSVEFYV